LGNDDSIRHYFSFTGDRIPLFAPFFSVLSYLSTLLSYVINFDAFIISSGNLKHKKIKELMNLIQIDLDASLETNQTLRQHIEQEQQVTSIANLKSEELYNKINDLVERRNVIAHGSNIDEILDVSVLQGYASFLENYGKAIFETLVYHTLKIEAMRKFLKAEKVVNIYKKHNALCVDLRNCTIEVGGLAIIKTENQEYYKVRISSIQVDRHKHNRYCVSQKTQTVCVTFDSSILVKQGWSYYFPK
jgi:hypothetical protein